MGTAAIGSLTYEIYIKTIMTLTHDAYNNKNNNNKEEVNSIFNTSFGYNRTLLERVLVVVK